MHATNRKVGGIFILLKILQCRYPVMPTAGIGKSCMLSNAPYSPETNGQLLYSELTPAACAAVLEF